MYLKLFYGELLKYKPKHENIANYNWSLIKDLTLKITQSARNTENEFWLFVYFDYRVI